MREFRWVWSCCALAPNLTRSKVPVARESGSVPTRVAGRLGRYERKPPGASSIGPGDRRDHCAGLGFFGRPRRVPLSHGGDGAVAAVGDRALAAEIPA